MLFNLRTKSLNSNMASLTITTNISEVVTKLGKDFQTIFNKDYLLRPVAIEVIPLMTERIHKDGEASDGSQIGTYSKGYLALRSGQFRNSEKFSRGAKKGKTKNAGFTTKQRVATPFGKSKYVYQDISADKIKREQYNRGTDPKVIVSLTRQLENNWSVLETTNGYGIGFTNPFNAEKLGWVEEAKGKVIRELTTSELDYAFDRIDELITDAFNK